LSLSGNKPQKDNNASKGKTSFKGIVYILVLIMVLGLIVLYSASSIVIFKSPDVETDYYFKKQLLNISIGLIIMFILAMIPFKTHVKYAPLYLIGNIFLLLAVFMYESNVGSARWIVLGPLNLQPSEFAKITVIVFISSYYYKHVNNKDNLYAKENESRFNYFIDRFLIPFGWIMLVSALIAMEPDLSSTLIIFTLGLLLMFIAGMKYSYLFLTIFIIVLGVVVVFQFDILKEYQMERIMSYLGLVTEGEAQGQVDIGLRAISSGGFFGEGLGMGNFKYLVPIQFTDFIFAILGEELGFIGMALLLTLYYLLCKTLVDAAVNGLENRAARLVVVGYAFLIMLQVVVNVGVVTGLLPPTGVTLPFVSYGGSSVLAFLAGFGFVISALNSDESDETASSE